MQFCKSKFVRSRIFFCKSRKTVMTFNVETFHESPSVMHFSEANFEERSTQMKNKFYESFLDLWKVLLLTHFTFKGIVGEKFLYSSNAWRIVCLKIFSLSLKNFLDSLNDTLRITKIQHKFIIRFVKTS